MRHLRPLWGNVIQEGSGPFATLYFPSEPTGELMKPKGMHLTRVLTGNAAVLPALFIEIKDFLPVANMQRADPGKVRGPSLGQRAAFSPCPQRRGQDTGRAEFPPPHGAVGLLVPQHVQRGLEHDPGVGPRAAPRGRKAVRYCLPLRVCQGFEVNRHGPYRNRTGAAPSSRDCSPGHARSVPRTQQSYTDMKTLREGRAPVRG